MQSDAGFVVEQIAQKGNNISLVPTKGYELAHQIYNCAKPMTQAVWKYSEAKVFGQNAPISDFFKVYTKNEADASRAQGAMDSAESQTASERLRQKAAEDANRDKLVRQKEQEAEVKEQEALEAQEEATRLKNEVGKRATDAAAKKKLEAEQKAADEKAVQTKEAADKANKILKQLKTDSKASQSSKGGTGGYDKLIYGANTALSSAELLRRAYNAAQSQTPAAPSFSGSAQRGTMAEAQRERTAYGLKDTVGPMGYDNPLNIQYAKEIGKTMNEADWQEILEAF